MLKKPKAFRLGSLAHRNSPKQEDRAAKKIGGRKTPGSGSGYQKADARRRGLVRIECKCTSADSFRVTKKDLDKLDAAVHGTTEIPIMEIEFLLQGRWVGALTKRKKVYVVSSEAMDDLLERLTNAAP